MRLHVRWLAHPCVNAKEEDVDPQAPGRGGRADALGGPGAIGSSMPLTGNQSSHLGNVGSITGGVLTDSGGTGSSHFNQQQANGQHKRGIQTSPDGEY